MRRFLALCLAGLGAAPTVEAGAWPQERGSWFASAAVHLTWPQDVTTWTGLQPTGRYDALYLEYGVTDRLTAGLDLGRSVSGAGKMVGFVRWPLTREGARIRIATELGLGRIEGAAVVRPGLSVGMGWDRGWVAADALVEQPLGGGTGADVKVDVTFGLTGARGRRTLLQVQMGQESGDPAFLRLAPSLVWPLTDHLSVEIGGAYGLVGDASMGVKLGLWADF